MSKSHRIKAIVEDEAFKEFVEGIKSSLTKKVMHHATLSEEGAAALAEYHALTKLISRMRSEAQNAESDNG